MHEGTPGLKPHQRCNPGAYVTERDFRTWAPGIAQAHGAELRQWGRQDELGATALAIVAVLSVFRGLRGGRDGCGVQMTLEGWAELLGRSRRMVAYAFDQLQACGWVWRRRRFVKVDWVDARGVRRKRADVWGVAYLSSLAAVRVARRGETRRLVLRRGAASRVLVAAGAVGNLLAEHASELRALALRITDAHRGCTPSYGVRRDKSVNRGKGTPAAAGALIPRAEHGPPRSERDNNRPLADGRSGLLDAELGRLLEVRALTPAQAWPDVWLRSDDRGRLWLLREFERYRPALTRRLVLDATPAQVAAAQRELDAAWRELGRVEARQPTRKARAVARHEARIVAFRRGVVQLGRELGRRN